MHLKTDREMCELNHASMYCYICDPSRRQFMRVRTDGEMCEFKPDSCVSRQINPIMRVRTDREMCEFKPDPCVSGQIETCVSLNPIHACQDR
eukprot:1393112-Amorphochlora_amoeboformis.AAC.1